MPLLASWARLDRLVPVLAVLAVAALLRVGTGLLDRLVPALALTYAATCVAGLGLSVWPWHLAPAPVGGLGLSVSVLAALVTGRRPAPPRRLGLVTLYDTIRGVGGYLFLHRAAATPLVGDPGFLAYPQGSHLVAALGENFLRHSGDPAAWAGNSCGGRSPRTSGCACRCCGACAGSPFPRHVARC